MPRSPTKAAESLLRDHALGYPETTETFPWGHRAIKVRGKTFLFMVGDADGLSVSAKLPETSMAALMLPNVEPTGYGMGGCGWVTAQFSPGEPVPVPMVKAWIDESFRAVAPKRLLESLGLQPACGPDRKPPAPGRGARATTRPEARPTRRVRAKTR